MDSAMGVDEGPGGGGGGGGGGSGGGGGDVTRTTPPRGGVGGGSDLAAIKRKMQGYAASKERDEAALADARAEIKELTARIVELQVRF